MCCFSPKRLRILVASRSAPVIPMERKGILIVVSEEVAPGWVPLEFLADGVSAHLPVWRQIGMAPDVV